MIIPGYTQGGSAWFYLKNIQGSGLSKCCGDCLGTVVPGRAVAAEWGGAMGGLLISHPCLHSLDELCPLHLPSYSFLPQRSRMSWLPAAWRHSVHHWLPGMGSQEVPFPHDTQILHPSASSTWICLPPTFTTVNALGWKDPVVILLTPQGEIDKMRQRGEETH